MGLADRHYMRGGRGSSIGAVPWGTVTMWLIVINFAVALIDSILFHWLGESDRLVLPWGTIVIYPPLRYWGHFSVARAVFGFQVWRFITFQFLHAGVVHIAVNLIGIYFFGPLIEDYLGKRRFLAFYLICGVAGAVGYLVLWAWSAATPMQLIVNSYVPLVGASAGLFGILVAAARIAPDETVLIYGILPMKLKMMAWVMLAIAAYTVFTAGHNAGGEAAHLGGAVMGWLLIRNGQWLDVFEPRRLRRLK